MGRGRNRARARQSDLQDIYFEEVGLERLARAAAVATRCSRQGEASCPRTSRRSTPRRAIKSLLTVPIVVADTGWGTIGFDDCVDGAEWSPAEKDALRTAASLLAAAIERERSEEMLREHEQKLRAVFDTALDAIFITDDERRYVDVNPAACEYFGVANAI